MTEPLDHAGNDPHAPVSQSERLRALAITWLGRWRGALLHNPIMGAAVVFSLLAAIYWLVLASDRYVSEARVLVQRTDLVAGATPDLASILVGDTSINRADQLVLREYLLSRDMVAKLDKELGLREHYSGWTIDPFSRLNFANSAEDLHRYYRNRVSVEFDEYAGVLVIGAQGFTPEKSHAIAALLVSEGERFMNATAHDLAEGQVEFLEGQVRALAERAMAARQAVIAYQNRQGIVSPLAQTEAIVAIVAQLEARRTELQIRLASQRAFLVDDHPQNVELEAQIAAIGAQIDRENARLAAPEGGSLNTRMEEFERLAAEAKFAEELYATSLVALEKGRVESTRTIKQLTTIQTPNLPQEAELPERLNKAIVYALVAFLIAGVAQLLTMIVRDHRD